MHIASAHHNKMGLGASSLQGTCASNDDGFQSIFCHYSSQIYHASWWAIRMLLVNRQLRILTWAIVSGQINHCSCYHHLQTPQKGLARLSDWKECQAFSDCLLVFKCSDSFKLHLSHSSLSLLGIKNEDKVCEYYS